MKACVIGGGSWGSAFALHLGRKGLKTRLWIREEDLYADILLSRENKTFLPGYTFPETVSFSNRLDEAVKGAKLVFIAVPSKFCSAVYEEMALHLSGDQITVSLTKGFEETTLQRMSELMHQTFSRYFKPRTAVLSGPSFAKEVAEAQPTAVVIASEDISIAQAVQKAVSDLSFRCYTSTDVIGVELAGAFKNVIAIAAGISDALQFGHNSRAALITRGIAEVTRLGLKMGARIETFAGLAGMGDLVLTCTGGLSRNRFVGMELGKGKNLEEIRAGMTMIAEGVFTTLSVRKLAARQHVETPITGQVYDVLYENKDPRAALQYLMSRTLKEEHY
jgi:glycerol-3-phosphate dehydrogenase (NAD(P)+)